jgi:hypothetical protein
MNSYGYLFNLARYPVGYPTISVPVSGGIPVPYIKKGRVNQPDIRCIPILNYFSEQRYRATLLKQCKLIDIMVFIHTNSPSEQDRSKQILYLSSTGTNLPN